MAAVSHLYDRRVTSRETKGRFRELVLFPFVSQGCQEAWNEGEITGSARQKPWSLSAAAFPPNRVIVHRDLTGAVEYERRVFQCLQRPCPQCLAPELAPPRGEVDKHRL